MRFFAEYFWHSEGWTPRNEALMEAVVKQMRTITRPWLIACDANMCSEDFKKSLWYKSRHMFIEAPGEGGATCISKGPKLPQLRREIGSACAVRESTEFARLHGLDHSVWQRLAVVGCQLWLVNLLVPWGRWPDDEMLSPWVLRGCLCS